jgi:hypothetical protein
VESLRSTAEVESGGSRMFLVGAGQSGTSLCINIVMKNVPTRTQIGDREDTQATPN